ncbi:MAG: hypothetical protein NZ911_05220 [Sulfolobales archaeon]|nr:hypothetical protein [Sulfolobales archaeon]
MEDLQMILQGITHGSLAHASDNMLSLEGQALTLHNTYVLLGG